MGAFIGDTLLLLPIKQCSNVPRVFHPLRQRRVCDIEVELMLSRDRKGAEIWKLKVVCNEKSHGFALCLDDVLHGVLYVLVLP